MEGTTLMVGSALGLGAALTLRSSRVWAQNRLAVAREYTSDNGWLCGNVQPEQGQNHGSTFRTCRPALAHGNGRQNKSE
jgi:hypothetical protein